MKPLMIVCASLIVLFFVLQGFISKSSSDIEQYPYEVIKKYSEIEIRDYKAALFTSVDLKTGNYRQNSGGGFRILANYIFGGNGTGEQIAMTSPVVMSMDSSAQKMSFMVPASYKKESLPKPDNSSIYFESKENCIMAAIQFGGWANDEKIEKHKQKLIKQLKKHGIEHKGNFSYMGYNPPYEMMNRRNEVVVELQNYTPE